MLEGYIHELVLKDQYIYIVGNNFGLRIFDITDANNPAGVFNSGGDYSTIAISDTVAYLGRSDAIQLRSISDPYNSWEISCLPDTYPGLHDLAESGGFLYVAHGNVAEAQFGLRVFDFSDPYNLVELSTYDSWGWSFLMSVIPLIRRGWVTSGRWIMRRE